jgi:hypothetical protein
MPPKKVSESSPLTFDLKADLLSKLESVRRKLGVGSKSEVIRYAISVFDYSSYQSSVQEHRQISVRLPLKQKASLLKIARQKKVSVGELLRAALESLPANVAGAEKQTQTKKVEPMKKATKKAAKKAARKAPAKKAAKKAVKKVAKKAKKAVKKVARKAKAAKKAVKKAVKRKAPAKKAAKRKAPAKKAAKRKAPAKKAAKKAPAKKAARKRAAKKRK